MSIKQEFIENISSKLGRPMPKSVPPVDFSAPLFQLNSQEERVDNFIKIWESLGGKGAKAKTAEEAAAVLKGWFGDQPAWLSPEAIVSWSDLPVIARATLDQLGWQMRPYPEISADRDVRVETIGKAELGITGADYGIAHSGTLVLKGDAKRGRAVSLVPTRHLAFIAKSKILDNLDQVMEEFSKLDTVPTGIDLISGPSRTSDIEMDLSIGVHGPIEVYAIVVENE